MTSHDEKTLYALHRAKKQQTETAIAVADCLHEANTQYCFEKITEIQMSNIIHYTEQKTPNFMPHHTNLVEKSKDISMHFRI